MRTKKLTTSDRVNQLLSKDEPQFNTIVALEKLEILLALNWYSQNKTKEDSYKYLAQYCKQNNIKATARQIESQVSTLGFVCRMVTRGAILDATSLKWLKKKLTQLTTMVEIIVDDPMKTNPTPVRQVNIQDRIKATARKCIGALEGCVDSFILSDFKKLPNTLEVMREYDLKSPHCPHIVNFFKKWRDEFRVALTEKDAAVNEAYSNYTLVQMKKMESLYDQIISDVLKVMGDATATKAPRAKKEKTPEQQVKRMKYKEKDTELNINSVPPTRIIGSECLWSYHVPSRTLTCYVADDVSGLKIQGSGVLNYSTTKSRTKKLRKPNDILPKVVGGGKVYLRNLMDDLTTKDVKVTGRLNSQTLLLKVIV